MSNLREKILSLEPNSNTSNQTALVDGIYITSQAVRRQALSFIWAKYNMLPDNLTQSLGRLYDAVEEIYLPDKNEKSLFNYTHDKSSVYSRSIAEKNLTVKDGNVQRSVTETPRDAYNSWYGTAYQGRDYYNTLSGYNESFSENTKIIYDDHTLNSIDNDGYVAIDYENEIAIEYAPLTAATQSSYNELNSYKKPRKKDFRKAGTDSETAYENALDAWKTKKTNEGRKKFRKGKKDAKDEYRENLEQQNSFIREPKTLLTKTSKLFKENKIESLVTRTFDINTNASFIDTSVNKTSGRSRGRNLRKKNEDTLFPFCRAWVAHHQYGKENSLIRPFLVTGKNLEESELIQKFRAPEGGTYLKDYSVLKNGIVKITPEASSTSGAGYNTKNCMFSIENLAWKDVNPMYHLSEEQRGPNGGRIMWFPPYDLQFQENSSVNWNEVNFIGRGEPIYTYTNTKRTGSLSFTLLIDHPSIINEFKNRSDEEKDKNNEDNDILRFFAGCDLPMKLKTQPPIKEVVVEQAPPEPEEEIVTSSDTEIKELTFNIHFPYGYSGHFNHFTNDDSDWDEYLFAGNDTSVDWKAPRGYEITSGLSISSTQIKDDIMHFRTDKRSEKNGEKNILFPNTQFFTNKNANTLNSMKQDRKYSFSHFITLFKYDNENVKARAKNIGILNDENIFIDENIRQLFEIIKNGDISDIDSVNITSTGRFSNSFKTRDENIIRKRGELCKKFIIDHCRVDNEKINITSNTTKSGGSMDTLVYKQDEKVEIVFNYNAPITVNSTPTTDEISTSLRNNNSNNENSGNNPQNTPNTNPILDSLIRVTGVTQYPDYNEGEYFKNLYKYDSDALKKISERIKYFDPAYHSISPEGFNSRLTFLHQCTRQGHTIERRENDIANTYSTAGNMAFGRPPFCVLRIGDFINTKILIRSLNIVYQNGNGMQWDMNPEGIGVQPMFAKVTMQIEIIGGQSLDAPVSRLNNAVSFNYYANTGVYDNRADRAIYNGTGITYSNLYEPQRIVHTPSSDSDLNKPQSIDNRPSSVGT